MMGPKHKTKNKTNPVPENTVIGILAGIILKSGQRKSSDLEIVATFTSNDWFSCGFC